VRLALLSDQHGNDVAFRAVLADVERLGVEEIVCLGDVVQGGSEPAQTLDRLAALGGETVLGNADAFLLEVPSASPEPVTEPAPEPAPLETPPDEGSTTGAGFTLDDVIEAWPDVLGALKAPVRAAVQDAQPIALDAGVIVFGVSPRRKDAINERFRKEADAIKEAFSARLGVQPRFRVRAHDFEATDALRPAQPSAQTEPPQPDEEAVDLEELVDAPPAPPSDSVARLVADLGAEVVEERPR